MGDRPERSDPTAATRPPDTCILSCYSLQVDRDQIQKSNRSPGATTGGWFDDFNATWYGCTSHLNGFESGLVAFSSSFRVTNPMGIRGTTGMMWSPRMGTTSYGEWAAPWRANERAQRAIECERVIV